MPENLEEEKYFVTSCCDEPLRIFFDKESAFGSEETYVDSFNVKGIKLKAYMYDDKTKTYTTDF